MIWFKRNSLEEQLACLEAEDKVHRQIVDQMGSMTLFDRDRLISRAGKIAVLKHKLARKP